MAKSTMMIVFLFMLILFCAVISAKVTINGYENTPDVKYYLINLPHRQNKRQNFEQHFGTNYIHMEAVDGRTLKNSWTCLDEHQGYKGLQMSNIKVLNHALKNGFEYIVVFEDDAEPPPNFNSIVLETISRFPDSKIIYMDSRNASGHNIVPGCCTCAVVYHKSVFELLRKELDPVQSEIMKTYREKYGKNCLYDWLLADILLANNVPCSSHPIVPSGRFKSDIS